jgi:hypothetical protein
MPDYIFYSAVFSVAALVLIALMARETVSRLRAGPVRFRLAMASQANVLRGIDALALLAVLVGPQAVYLQITKKKNLEGTLPLTLMLFVFVRMFSLSSPLRDAKRWLVLASGLLSLVTGAVALSVGLRALQAGTSWAQPWPGPFMLVLSVFLFVIGVAAIQEYVSGTRVRERGIEMFRTTRPWSRIAVKDWQAREGGFDLHLTVLTSRLFGMRWGPDREVPVPASERPALEAFLAEHTATAG